MGLDINQQAEAFDRSNTGQAIGTNDANNAFSSASVAANVDGSILERLEHLKDQISGTDSATNVLGADNANNAFASTNVVANDDGSILERLEGVLQRVSGVDGATNVLGADDSDNGFASTSVAANRDGSVLERSEFLIQAIEKSAQSASQTLSSGATIFTVANGPVAILSLQSVCQNENSGGAATTLQWRNAPTVGTANTFSGASASLASAVAGSTVSLDGTALTTAPTVLLTGGAQLDAIRSIIVQAGTITTTVANGPSTGSYIHYIRYCPLTPTAVVS